MAVRIHNHGGVEAMRYEEVTVASPSENQVLVRNAAIGVNYADIYEREADHGGPHASRPLPITLGRMAVGIVEEVGSKVSHVKAGERVGYLSPDSYATYTLVPADRALKLPDYVADDVAAGYLLRGLTAEYLVRRLYPLRPGAVALVHAAAGGMGLVLGQWGWHLGARMIGTVSSAQKAEVARQHGYEDIINYSNEDFAKRALELTSGRGVDVIYDGVGKVTFMGDLACIKPRGMVISYGTASGNVGMFDLQLLHSKSIIVTRPTLRSWISDRQEYEQAAAAFFELIEHNLISTPIGARLPLSQAAQAHELLQSRQTTAPVILLP